MPTKRCISCRYWNAPPQGEIGCAGHCRRPSLTSGNAGPVQTNSSDSCEEWAQMTFYTARDGSLSPDRRNTARTSVDFPARLQTTGGDWSGRLSDFSETGARLRLANPPRAGTQALLKCGSDEIFCKIAWSLDDACGLTFDRPVPRTVVLEISGHNDNAPPSVANLSKIPAGKKRTVLAEPGPGHFAIAVPQSDATVAGAAPIAASCLAAPAAGICAFESRDESGYIKFYPFRAMANP